VAEFRTADVFDVIQTDGQPFPVTLSYEHESDDGSEERAADLGRRPICSCLREENASLAIESHRSNGDPSARSSDPCRFDSYTRSQRLV
jgi:hypothetical protein